MSFTVAEIAEKIRGEVLGDGSLQISGFAPASIAKPGDLTFAENPTYFAAAEQSLASAIIVADNFVSEKKTLIRVANARVGLARTLPIFFPPEQFPQGIHPGAVVHEAIRFGDMRNNINFAFVSPARWALSIGISQPKQARLPQ